MAMIPYGRQTIGEDDIDAVSAVLKSDWLTTGPEVEAFEKDVAAVVGARFGVAVNSGTAALHCAYRAAGIGPGDEVIVPTMTFAATANAALYLGAKPVFCDVESETLHLDIACAEKLITPKTKALVTVDYAGQPSDYDGLRSLCGARGLKLVADGCHALGATYKGQTLGHLADYTALSFHPVKHVATGEGGMVTTNDADGARTMKIFRNHGITTDHRQREAGATWRYEMTELGYNYRISDILCALGRSQLKKTPAWLQRRRAIAKRYDAYFKDIKGVRPLLLKPDREHAYHLYVVRVGAGAKVGRDEAFTQLRELGLGVNVHYIPVHYHPYYRKHLGTGVGQCPRAEAAFEEILSLPMYPGLDETTLDKVIETLSKVFS
jgi:perosamine synthetase